MDLESVVFGEMKADPKHSDKDFKDAYRWLEKEVGFYPLFLAVGSTEEDVRMTGYQNQWRRLLSTGPDGNTYRKKGDFPNFVLFSFENVEGIFTDYAAWHLVLNSSYNNYQITEYEKRLIFKHSWVRSRLVRKARKEHHSVQLITPKLYLPDAGRVWVRNQETKKGLESKGFENVKVKRLSLEGSKLS
jgi:hypothetical protein